MDKGPLHFKHFSTCPESFNLMSFADMLLMHLFLGYKFFYSTIQFSSVHFIYNPNTFN